VAVLSEIVVRRYWNGEDALDRRVRLDGAWRRVVGIVGDVRNPVGADLQPTAYRPFAQNPQASAILFMRAAGDPIALVGAVRNQLRAFDPTAPEFRPADLETAVRDYLSPQRFTTSLLGFFALLGLLLAALGVYGVMRYWVAAHMRDIGIRVALGADRAGVIRLVLGRALQALLVGTIVGIAGALALQKVIVAQLYDISPVDPPVFAAVSAILATVALLAAYLPARRAAGVDPVTVLKQE
jgi:predicted lysophospholipase L1 biosynthesis ABC-type transport system permease subunit